MEGGGAKGSAQMSPSLGGDHCVQTKLRSVTGSLFRYLLSGVNLREPRVLSYEFRDEPTSLRRAERHRICTEPREDILHYSKWFRNVPLS